MSKLSRSCNFSWRTAMTISPELTLLFKYVLGLPDYEPAHLDDVADVMDYELSDKKLSQICKSLEGLPITSWHQSFRYSCTLRQQLDRELMDIETETPSEAGVLVTDLIFLSKII